MENRTPKWGGRGPAVMADELGGVDGAVPRAGAGAPRGEAVRIVASCSAGASRRSWVLTCSWASLPWSTCCWVVSLVAFVGKGGANIFAARGPSGERVARVTAAERKRFTMPPP